MDKQQTSVFHDEQKVNGLRKNDWAKENKLPFSIFRLKQQHTYICTYMYMCLCVYVYVPCMYMFTCVYMDTELTEMATSVCLLQTGNRNGKRKFVFPWSANNKW